MAEAESTVLLVDDHDLIRQGLARAFEGTQGMRVVGQAGSVAQAWTLAAELEPDVVVTDLRLPDGSGLELVRRLRALSASMGLVVLTMYVGDDHLLGALEAGASAFVSKDAPAEDVVTAARHASTSPGSFTAANLAEALLRRRNSAPPQLTPREVRVLHLLADGLGVSAIAHQLFLSESTTKTDISKIYEKLGAANRAQAIVSAVRAGLILVDLDETHRR